MFVAYLMPQIDVHLAMEDGLGFIAKGKTKEEAEQAVRTQFDEVFAEDEMATRREMWNVEYKLFTVEL